MGSDELNDYEDEADRDEAVVTELVVEQDLSDADELPDAEGEGDSTPFDETRAAYSGVLEGDDDVDLAELASAGALLDDPDRVGDIDDPDDVNLVDDDDDD